MTGRIPAITVKTLIACFSALGLDTAELLEKAQLSPDSINSWRESVPNEYFVRLWSAAYALSSDPLLAGRAGFAVPDNAFGLIDQLGKYARDVREGIGLVGAYLRLVATNLELSIERAPRDMLIVSNDPSEAGFRTAEEWTLAIIVSRFRSIIPGFTPAKVHLPSAMELDKSDLEALWGAPVRVGGNRTAVEFAPGVLNLANPLADRSLSDTLRQAADRIPEDDGLDRSLRSLIWARLDGLLNQGSAGLPQIARDLSVSVRSLQRRLASEQLNYRELLDDFRRDRAILALKEGERYLGDLAFRLGYREQSSFNRAFRRWTGVSPSVYIRRLHNSSVG
jgi:AraC-like DNA-binding protein